MKTLSRKLVTMKIEEGGSVEEHITNLKILNEQLEASLPNGEVMFQEELLVILLLCNLSPLYENLIMFSYNGDKYSDSRFLQEEAKRKKKCIMTRTWTWRNMFFWLVVRIRNTPKMKSLITIMINLVILPNF